MALTAFKEWLGLAPIPLLGVDVSTTAVKVISLAQEGGALPVITGYAVEPLPEGAVHEREVRDPAAVGAALESALTRGGFQTSNAAIAVAGSAVILKQIQMSADLTDAERLAQLEAEAERYIPYAVDDIHFDFEVLGVHAQNPAWVDVLLAAAKRDIVAQRVAVLHMGGLEARVVDIESYAVERAFQCLAPFEIPEYFEKVVGVVDLGAHITSLTVMDAGRMIFARDQLFGGHQLTEATQMHYQMKYEEAGEYKKRTTFEDDYEATILEPFRQAIAQQIQLNLEFYHSQHGNRPIDALYITGGTAQLLGLMAQLEKHFNVPVILSQPLAHLSTAPKVALPSLQKDASSLLLGLGLALRSFNRDHQS